ncbi:hypothetical protein H5410_052733 [Solanum commersonii]|uniref:Late embryogenesis abundant protein LEA-2 subgroup domain-containing protein n=1 Tax=Solanum commersonii TaxID=4109 RepID=A0A9J5X2C4_SOLCO|nr:hypothetical protein H5410_052733 [Solanum commersonii]
MIEHTNSSRRIIEMEMESSSNLGENRSYNVEDCKYTRRHKRKRKICMFILCAYMLFTITSTILNFTVFRPKRPTINLNSITLEDLAVSVDAARFKVNLNITMNGSVSVENHNRASFQYEDINPYIEYGGQEIGDVHIPAGKIGARTTTTMNFTLIIMANQISSNPNLFSDVVEKGMLQLTLYMKLKGKVKLNVLFKIKIKASSKCDLYLDIRNGTLANQSCHSKIKL